MRSTFTASEASLGEGGHLHVFLGADHESSERMTWAVIVLCGVMMVAEIVGGLLFGSIALIADGLHMSTHAGALLLAALAYSFARRHAHDPRFTFGTGKLGDLAGFTSAIVLVMIALLIGYESVVRLFAPISIRFAEAIPIACLGLAVNIVSAWLLSRGGHHHHHGHGHEHDEEEHRIEVAGRLCNLSVHEDGVPPRFRLSVVGQGNAQPLDAKSTMLTTLRPDGTRQVFAMADAGDYLESIDEIPEPHAFSVHIGPALQGAPVAIFEEHHHGDHHAHRDNNMRAAIVHVAADAAVSVLVIVGLVLARAFGWLWMDPLAGIAGACVIASWSYGLVRDTGAILLDMNPDRSLAANLRKTLEQDGDRLADLHLWRVGPGHLAAIISIATNQPQPPQYYRDKLTVFKALSHVTVEVIPGAARAGSKYLI